jgi:hypothetical protein
MFVGNANSYPESELLQEVGLTAFARVGSKVKANSCSDQVG